jgi:mannose-6-phosphate isomerase
MPVDPRLDAIRRPLQLQYHPVYRSYEGGGLAQAFRGLRYPKDTRWSEDWVGSVTTARNPDPDGREQGLSRVDVPGVGPVTIRDLVEAYPEQMVGANFAHRWGVTTGVLVKLLAPGSRVPVHGHPDRAWASERLGSPWGKAEAWIILETPSMEEEPPYAGIGFREGVTYQGFRAAMDRRDSTELRAMLHKIEIHPGETWLMNPRIPHLLDRRLLFIEVQEPSDHIVIPEWWASGADEDAATMGLGWDLALEMLDFTATLSRDEALGRARQRGTALRSDTGASRSGSDAGVGPTRETRLFDLGALPYFDAHQLDVGDVLPVEDGRFSIYVVTAGDGWIEGEFGRQPISRGQTFAAAASLRHRFVAGRAPLQVVRCMGPVAE